ncbi:Oligopeptide transport ATP-binding protein OppD [Pseudoruegeria aquimaris]|uniref:Oligopeptide transport ATP-binding protein OppD n=1 Tax=Pseudoruegeria aquimaris TaxID=393663 RepID=A0A1Y5SRF6_9RHOB|nr:ABC transporter ATP-binding protein [Pseudoruegeria aquimaris]SLN43510.1 Oligopeptide transport ATP-binding protein OppD [Pseudoruegeria aquimaris]
MSLLSVQDLAIRFSTGDGTVHAVNNVSFDIAPGEKVALVGESGSGKSQIALSIMGLLAKNAQVSGRILHEGRDLLTLSQDALNKVRAKKIAMIFQDPMSALNPYMRVGRQLTEIVELHEGLGRADARKRAIEAMEAVQIPDAKNRIDAYPHEFSGGMRQRIVIAMALICKPGLILADEPTTALDVTVQAQIMRLLDEIQSELNTAVLLITHDLGVVAGFCDRSMVLYGGRMMETAPTKDLFAAPSHPYTRGLLRAVPNINDAAGELRAIPGSPPNQLRPLTHCPFAARCVDAVEQCRSTLPELTGEATKRACLRPVEALS